MAACDCILTSSPPVEVGSIRLKIEDNVVCPFWSNVTLIDLLLESHSLGVKVDFDADAQQALMRRFPLGMQVVFSSKGTNDASFSSDFLGDRRRARIDPSLLPVFNSGVWLKSISFSFVLIYSRLSTSLTCDN